MDFKYHCFTCGRSEAPNVVPSTLETCDKCFLVKFCSDACKNNAAEKHQVLCNQRSQDLEKLNGVVPFGLEIFYVRPDSVRPDVAAVPVPPQPAAEVIDLEPGDPNPPNPESHDVAPVGLSPQSDEASMGLRAQNKEPRIAFASAIRNSNAEETYENYYEDFEEWNNTEPATHDKPIDKREWEKAQKQKCAILNIDVDAMKARIVRCPRSKIARIEVTDEGEDSDESSAGSSTGTPIECSSDESVIEVPVPPVPPKPATEVIDLESGDPEPCKPKLRGLDDWLVQNQAAYDNIIGDTIGEGHSAQPLNPWIVTQGPEPREAELRDVDVWMAQYQSAKAKEKVVDGMIADQEKTLKETFNLLVKVGQETFQWAVEQGDFYLFELAMAYSNQIFILMENRDSLFGYPKRNEEAKYLCILFILRKKSEMEKFLEDRDVPDWFGHFATLLQNILVSEASPQDIADSVNFKSMLTEFGNVAELRYLMDTIFKIPDNLCLWTISSLDVELQDEIGKIGKWFSKLLPKKW